MVLHKVVTERDIHVDYIEDISIQTLFGLGLNGIQFEPQHLTTKVFFTTIMWNMVCYYWFCWQYQCWSPVGSRSDSHHPEHRGGSEDH